jgi:hypothetical protein
MDGLTAAVVAAVAMLGIDCSQVPQGKPNFSGTWTLLAKPGAGAVRPQSSGGTAGRGGPVGSVGGGAFWCGGECTIVHTATTLTITRHAPGETHPPIVLSLDGKPSSAAQADRGAEASTGKPSSAAQADRGGAASTQAVLTRWDGDKLIVTRSLDAQGRFTTTQVVSLESGHMILLTSHTIDGVPPDGAKPGSLTYTKKE